ncbi:MAG: acetyl-CoA carboxylase carboxyl transferase subunit alpha [Candidatus Marinimicrobia bacterium]|nr:acetyl-CoA carboxylase carboxyl transferase subunit alpha [Candidatus Neomarinimicrobiota bacterium]|tara:strand:- start:1174 stop:2130 length:957 start_codon:yes stop_codon:yes gene_type:complete
MTKYTLNFEKPLKDIEDKIISLKNTSNKTGLDVSHQIITLEKELRNKSNEIYKNLTRWERVQLARHPKRPNTLDYIRVITDNFFELHGDRCFGDDPAIISGIGKIESKSVFIIGHQKGKGTKDKLKRNFGMPRPEGYRKAYRIMQLAEKFSIPIITFLDTPGAYPGLGAEQRGQAEAIAKNIYKMSFLKTPILSIVIGEGASGGALGIGVCDKLVCLENTWYSVISPEGCASILYHDSTKAEDAADSMKVTSLDLLKMGIADGIIDEPTGGAHNDLLSTGELVKKSILQFINEYEQKSIDELINNRLKKYDSMGNWDE